MSRTWISFLVCDTRDPVTISEAICWFCLYFIKSVVRAAVYQETLDRLILPSADELYGGTDFIFRYNLAPAYISKTIITKFNDSVLAVLCWPANLLGLNPTEHEWSIVKRNTTDTRANNGDKLKANIKVKWTSELPITFRPQHIGAINHKNEALRAYIIWHINNILKAWCFCIAVIFVNSF